MPDYYETDRLLSEYLLMHYGTKTELMPWDFGPKDAIGFPCRTVKHFPKTTGKTQALDLGCAVGRSSFELSKTCDAVIGIDYSHNFIDTAETLRNQGAIDYLIKETGHQKQPATARIPEDSRPEHVQFRHGDAMNLPDDLGTFDRIHAANLICRLPEPEKLLQNLPNLITPQGYLVLATPCTWLEEYTPNQNQPQENTFEWLKQQLSPSFSLISRHDEPFLIRETARKYQWSVSLVTLWQRK